MFTLLKYIIYLLESLIFTWNVVVNLTLINVFVLFSVDFQNAVKYVKYIINVRWFRKKKQSLSCCLVVRITLGCQSHRLCFCSPHMCSFEYCQGAVRRRAPFCPPCSFIHLYSLSQTGDMFTQYPSTDCLLILLSALSGRGL